MDYDVNYAEFGSGMPVLALHGAGVDHREIAGALEPLFADRTGYRRIYPDLPGMGHTPAPATITSNDDVVDVLLGLVASHRRRRLRRHRPVLRRLPRPGHREPAT